MSRLKRYDWLQICRLTSIWPFLGARLTNHFFCSGRVSHAWTSHNSQQASPRALSRQETSRWQYHHLNHRIRLMATFSELLSFPLQSEIFWSWACLTSLSKFLDCMVAQDCVRGSLSFAHLKPSLSYFGEESVHRYILAEGQRDLQSYSGPLASFGHQLSLLHSQLRAQNSLKRLRPILGRQS